MNAEYFIQEIQAKDIPNALKNAVKVPTYIEEHAPVLHIVVVPLKIVTKEFKIATL